MIKGIIIILCLNAINSKPMAGFSNPSWGTRDNIKKKEKKPSNELLVSLSHLLTNGKSVTRMNQKDPLGVVPEGRNTWTFSCVSTNWFSHSFIKSTIFCSGTFQEYFLLFLVV